MELWKEIPFINKQSKGPNNFRVNYPRSYFNLFKSITNIDYGITLKKLAREENNTGQVKFSNRGGFHPNLFYGLGYQTHSCYACKDEGVLPSCLACGDTHEIRCWECIDEGEPGYLICQEGCDEGRVECNYCEGEGEIDCDDCDGQGNVDCDYCDEGRAPCEECEGNQKKECETCGGDGEIEDEDNDDETIECEDCEGTGEIDCEECDEGAVDCGECDGDGNLECDYCVDGRKDCDECEWGDGYTDCDYCDEGRSECDECSYNGIDRDGYVDCEICDEFEHRLEGDGCLVCENFNEEEIDPNIDKWKWFGYYTNRQGIDVNNSKPFIPFRNNLNSDRISVINEYINYNLGNYSSLGDAYGQAYNLKKLEEWIKSSPKNNPFFKSYLRNSLTERRIKVKAHTFSTTQFIDWRKLNFNTLTYMIIPKKWNLDEKSQFKATPVANRENFLVGDFYLLVIQGSKILPDLSEFYGTAWYSEGSNYANYWMDFSHFEPDSGKYSQTTNYHRGLQESEYKIGSSIKTDTETTLDRIFRCPGNLITVFKTNIEFSSFAFLNYRNLEPWFSMK